MRNGVSIPHGAAARGSWLLLSQRTVLMEVVRGRLGRRESALRLKPGKAARPNVVHGRSLIFFETIRQASKPFD